MYDEKVSSGSGCSEDGSDDPPPLLVPEEVALALGEDAVDAVVGEEELDMVDDHRHAEKQMATVTPAASTRHRPPR
ncbi:hypothetical protein EVJ58_g6637 [Rhodofomes roseus]|uniref:Uncharacterized protein n=1 Tax=Rhodofomes roseus TaxID=34475 RepID=A0A4Y9Y853_9APHY|nr:hypothetical protein EVJ58_g6637 [Rhodofomes roseus]